MTKQKENKILIKSADADAFMIPVKEGEESFYRTVTEQINANVNRFRFGANSDTSAVALAKVTLYYATMLYRQANLINNRAEMLKSFEERIDRLLEGTD